MVLLMILMDSSPVLLTSVISILAWLLPAVIAITRLRRRRNLDETAKAVWVLIILLLPIIGALTYLLMNSGRQNIDKQ